MSAISAGATDLSAHRQSMLKFTNSLEQCLSLRKDTYRRLVCRSRRPLYSRAKTMKYLFANVVSIPTPLENWRLLPSSVLHSLLNTTVGNLSTSYLQELQTSLLANSDAEYHPSLARNQSFIPAALLQKFPTSFLLGGGQLCHLRCPEWIWFGYSISTSHDPGVPSSLRSQSQQHFLFVLLS